MLDGKFYQQAKLILKVLPYLYKHDCFAIKGGTAINYFLRDLPRLSVDIDICYLPINDRDIALQNIVEHLKSISKQISTIHPELRIISRKTKNNILYGLFIGDEKVVIKIESNLIIRGTVFPIAKKNYVKLPRRNLNLLNSLVFYPLQIFLVVRFVLLLTDSIQEICLIFRFYYKMKAFLMIHENHLLYIS